MAIKIGGPTTCTYDGVCMQCSSFIYRGEDMFSVEDDRRPREWASVCSRECAEAWEVTLLLASDLDDQANKLRKGIK